MPEQYKDAQCVLWSFQNTIFCIRSIDTFKMTSPIKDLTNVQGDILLNGLSKEVETFWFFSIPDGQVSNFCTNLRQAAQQEITSTENMRTTRKNIKDWKKDPATSGMMAVVGANISFTFKGLQKVGRSFLTDKCDADSDQMSAKLKGLQLNTGDSVFEQGMRSDSTRALEDPVKPNTSDPDWDAEWLSNSLDGVLSVAGSDFQTVQDKINRITNLFGSSIKLAFKIDGNTRPGQFRGKEHFGYQDGISQPVVKDLPDLTKEEAFVPPGQDIIDQGTILCGRPGDSKAQSRPAWMLDGSFLVFRKLKQNVQDWDKFLVDSSNTLGTWPDQLGARLIGRWKSGCPVNLQAEWDDTNIGKDPMRNNLFEYDPPGLNNQFVDVNKAGSRIICPIGAHIRKTNPRGDQPSRGRVDVNPHRILRRGIPYGPEKDVSPNAERGLLFACYQSSIEQGFHFIQTAWANSPFFRFSGAGVDAVMGQQNNPGTIGMKGLFPQDASRELQLPAVNRFVVPRGGEYFFTPSISALTGVLSSVK